MMRQAWRTGALVNMPRVGLPCTMRITRGVSGWRVGSRIIACE